MSRRGMTLLEMMMVVAIMGILAAMAAPNLIGLVRHTRARGQAATLVATINSARAQAMTRGFPVVVCMTLTQVTIYQKQFPIVPPATVNSTTAPLAPGDRILDTQVIEPLTIFALPSSWAVPGQLVFDTNGNVTAYQAAVTCDGTTGTAPGSAAPYTFTVASGDRTEAFLVRVDGLAKLTP